MQALIVDTCMSRACCTHSHTQPSENAVQVAEIWAVSAPKACGSRAGLRSRPHQRGHAEHDGARRGGHQAHAGRAGRHLRHQRQQAGLQVERKAQHGERLGQLTAAALRRITHVCTPQHNS